ncbi:Ceramidase [Teratosphaeria destructans]|uniref:Ceramidase n=1 Tax=Teratosphaeria destructans TaxID=418781 RepID=A0A9W7SX68_9PEZI|nr:Ceramidase [Teratosphaeria destructans]
MLSWLPSIPYPPARSDGYWAPITSTIDWCEENYYVTRYSAEIVNAWTNLLFAWLAFKGMYNCYHHGHDRIFFLAFIGFLLVGSGSFAFHSTLKYPMQLVDELSMIYTTCLMFWATFGYDRGLAVKWALGFFTAGIAVGITAYYHYLQDPTFHQNAYAVLTALVLFRSMYVMEVRLRPYFRRRRLANEKIGKSDVVSEVDRREEERKDVRDAEIIQQMWFMVGLGLSIFLGGFAIWNLDNEYCSQIRKWRREIGLPWGILLEGHGWWHLMTGLGAYMYIVWGVWLRHCLNGRADEYELKWPSIWTSVPEIVKAKGRPSMNGEAKKKR